jgi:hypothetical protein
MNTTGTIYASPFHQKSDAQLGQDVILSKPVKGVTGYYGPVRTGNSDMTDAPQPTHTTSRRILERRTGGLPYSTSRKEYRTPDEQLLPVNPRESRVCVGLSDKTGNITRDRLNLERSMLPVAARTCPTHVDPRIGELTKSFSVRYTSTC